MKKLFIAVLALSVFTTAVYAKSQASTTKKDTPKGHRPIATYRTAKTADEQALFVNIDLGNTAEVKKLLNKGVNPNIYNAKQSTPLVEAINNREMDIVADLIKAGADVNQRTGLSHTPLRQAVTPYLESDAQYTKMLLEAGANPNLAIWDENPLDIVINHDNIYSNKANKNKILALLKEAGAVSIDTNNSEELVEAAKKGKIKKVQKLLDQGANVDSREHKSIFVQTAFMQAVLNDHFDVADLLLDNGADIQAVNHYGQTALNQSVKPTIKKNKNAFSRVQYLIENGANINLDNALTQCYRNEGYEHIVPEDVCALLVKNGADVNLPDRDGHNALFYVTAYGLEDSQKILLAYGATPMTEQDLKEVEAWKAKKAEESRQSWARIDAAVRAKQAEAKKDYNLGFWNTLLQGIADVGLGVAAKTGNVPAASLAQALSTTGTTTSGNGTCANGKYSGATCDKCVNTKPRTQAACATCCATLNKPLISASWEPIGPDPKYGAGPGCYCNFTNGNGVIFK